MNCRFLFARSASFACMLAFALCVSSHAQASHWAGPDDETAKYMIHMEHLWTDSACTHNKIEETLLAEDFVGTSPEGGRYTRQQAVQEAKDSKETARDCQTYEVKVHFFGDNVAVLYGSESSIRKAPSGAESTRNLVWTDTWLKRNGKWQIVAAEDLFANAK